MFDLRYLFSEFIRKTLKLLHPKQRNEQITINIIVRKKKKKIIY